MLTYQRLHPDAPLGLRIEACLPLRSRHNECRRCVETCPVHVLYLKEDTLSLENGCLGCGRCMAACPTGALAVSGFSLQEHAPDPAQKTVIVDCWRVPPQTSPAGAVRVPCLGGLSVSQLLALHLVANGGKLRLLDRGGCRRCAAAYGAGKHPAQASLSAARAWLREAGVPRSRLPAMEKRLLPDNALLRRISPPTAQQPMSRRNFFTQLARQLAVAADSVAFDVGDNGLSAATLGAGPKSPLRSIERDRLLKLLRELCARHGRSLPARLFPAIKVGPECRHDQLCATLCPTGALQVYRSKNTGGVTFEAAACIACGHCETVCPEQALRLHPQGTGRVPRGPEMLTQHSLRECRQCGTEFSDNAKGELCLACRRSQQFAERGFDALFRRHDGETPPSPET